MSCSKNTARTLAAALLLAGPALVLSACNKQQGQTDVPASARPMRSPDEATAVFDEAERELGDLFREEASGHAYGQPQPSTGVTPSAPAPAPPDPGDAPTADRQNRAMSRCSRACKALASMQRAADRLCDLTGEDDDRCTDVRARVTEARATVEKTCKTCDA